MHRILSWVILLDLILTPVAWCFAFPNRSIEILTFAAVLVALFKNDIYFFCFQPKLVLTVSLEGSHFYEIQPVNEPAGAFQAWFSVIVENRGLGVAKNVQLIFNGLESNLISNFNAYRGLPLPRGWILESTTRAFYKDTAIPYSICFIKKNEPNALRFALFATPSQLSSIVCTADRSGTFKFEVVAVSDNAPVAKKMVELTYNGGYMQGFRIDPGQRYANC